ncbi:hypothetical protein [Paludibaculum fermentans]|uniref:Cthe-2314-like HEPN domain-containing protein n=1 Tax=Paludibaculum fermentans TaxID=1473598 RepID=A0A7S7SKT0_PALFE|nr:hypothetical protein [Paludibaculum fermentans]QOY88028.1 hypothetical protein IRI77_35720 [Paludibaculum fermentans]
MARHHSNKLSIPRDFPDAFYRSVHATVTPKLGNQSDHQTNFLGGWNALQYRFRACADSDASFRRLVNRYGDAPPQPYRYQQERDLFAFFGAALSTIESFSFALFSLGAKVNPGRFPISTAQDLKRISPENTCGAFQHAFPRSNLTLGFAAALQDAQYLQLKEVRNILIHRSAPGRIIYSSSAMGDRLPLPATSDATWISGIPINVDTTAAPRRWLAAKLKDLLRETAFFVATQL